MFNYTVLTEEEIQKEKEGLPPGTYDFQVVEARSKISKASGNDMLELKLKLWDKAGNIHHAYDWLVPSRKMIWKIKRFWESVGEPQNYNGKCDTYDFLNKCGLVEIIQKKNENGDPIMRVKDYIVKVRGNNFDDDIPL